MDLKREVQKQFGRNASHYVLSPLHAQGQDLAMLLEAAGVEDTMHILDAATGGGHVSKLFAPLVKRVTAFDLTAEMLEQAKGFLDGYGIGNVDFVQGDAEKMPFADEAFDRVACRIAAHHFPDVNAFVREAYRVLRPGGCLLLIDNVAPEKDSLDRFYNEVEKRRDPSHYRAWKKSEWVRFAEEAGFTAELLVSFPKTFLFRDWCDRMDVKEPVRQELERAFLQATPEQRSHFHITGQEGRLVSFQGQGALLRARKPDAERP